MACFQFLIGIVHFFDAACVCEQYQREKGYFSKREPVAIFKRPESAVVIWKQWFTETQGEFAAEMVLVSQNGKYLVDHVMVF